MLSASFDLPAPAVTRSLPVANQAPGSDSEFATIFAEQKPAAEADDQALRTAFEQFVGETFYGQMLKSMRQTVHKPAYFHGGRAEEIFQQQLDQVLSQTLAEASADQFSGPMYELFTMQRQ